MLNIYLIENFGLGLNIGKGFAAMERVLRLYIRRLLIEKKWSDFNAAKGKTIQLKVSDFSDPLPGVRDLDDEIFDLIQNAYSDVELEPGKFGNAKVRKPEDLPAGYTIMQAADLDEDPDPDFFRGSKMKSGRVKLGIVGHDGSAQAIEKYLEETAKQLLSGGISEMSGKIAHIMITRYGVPAVTDPAQVEAMLGKSVEWIGRHPEDKYADRYGPDHEGWYCRGIGSCNTLHMKILLGAI